jgi:hypothetical protein
MNRRFTERQVIRAFWKRVNKNGPLPLDRPELGRCWLWMTGIKGDGYGAFTANGKSLLAHRFSYTILIGPIPDGLELDHLCRRTGCVNPSHLEPVTSLENTQRGERATRTHCRRGHPYSGSNLYLLPHVKGRDCRTCRKLANQKRKKAKNEQKIANSIIA